MDPALQPPVLRPPDAASRRASPATISSRFQPRLIWVAIGLFTALALIVLIALPWLIDQRVADSLTTTTQPIANDPNSQSVPQVGIASHDAQQALRDFLRIRAQPDLDNVKVWAKEEWQQALDTAKAGDDHYGHGRFDEAANAYRTGSDQLSLLRNSRAQRLADTLEQGEQWLQQNSSKRAAAAFEQVLAMQPDHDLASQGLAHANVRDQVFALILEAQKLEQSQDPQGALDVYNTALQFDPAYTPTREAIKKVKNVLANRVYLEAMSEALNKLNNGYFAAAAEALDTASRIHPNAPEVKDTRQRLLVSKRLHTLTQLRNSAERYVAAEQWSDAAATYRKALKIDEKATFATIGNKKAGKRLELNAQLDHYLLDLSRLESEEPLNNAKNLLEVGGNIPEDEPKLAIKFVQLAEAVRLAELPVNLQIQSDNQTEVTIYHIGRLGKFHHKQLSLKPGRYTVVGFRPGYRDVRKDVILRPSTSENTVLVRCEESI